MFQQIFFYSLLGSIALVPVLPLSVSRLFFPAFVLISSLLLFRLFRWRSNQSRRAIFKLDQRLDMAATGITAWEILGRGENNAPELLVLDEACDKLIGLQPKRLFRRRLKWHALAALPLFPIWVFLVWFGAKVGPAEPGAGHSVAQRLKEFSSKIQKRTELYELKESSRLVQGLEKALKPSLEAKVGEESLKKKIASLLDAMGPAGKENWAEVSTDALASIGMETSELSLWLEKVRQLKEELKAPRVTEGALGHWKEQVKRLASRPEWREESERKGAAFETLGKDEMREVLERVEKKMLSELDRLTLSEIRDFLGSLVEEMDDKDEADATEQKGGSELASSSESNEPTRSGSHPGNQPGTSGDALLSSRPLEARAPLGLAGLVKEGRSVGFGFQAAGRGQKSKIPQEEVVASYQRQAEEDLGSEEIPEGFKEAIRDYFLSLGRGADESRTRSVSDKRWKP